MARSLPPLNWIRGFEAAARHQSFMRAAEELGVSAGAISQQVKALENRLGAVLFERQARGVRLTSSGQSYRDALTPALDAIDQATRQVSEIDGVAKLRLAALPAIAERWLTPRLSRFQVFAPDIAVRLATAETLAEASKRGFDVAIHYESEATDGICLMPLFRDLIFPVCAPSLARKMKIRSPADLPRCRLLYDTKWAADWSHWCRAAKLKAPDLARETGFSLYSMALEAAIAGQGVLMGHHALVARELQAKRLVAPFELKVPVRHRYAALYAEKDGNRPQVAAFLQWLRSEVAGSVETLE